MDATDKSLTVAFIASAGMHLVLLIGPIFSMPWFSIPKTRAPIEVIYEYEVSKDELRHIQDKLTRASGSPINSPSPSPVGERAQVRIPDRPSLTASYSIDDIMPSRASVVDLTNLGRRRKGRPRAIELFQRNREQIQKTANNGTWLNKETNEGLVYVSFTLVSSGQVRDLAIVSSRSANLPPLQNTALKIINQAAPFPPFPPSMNEPNKTVVVPLEFLLGS